MVFKWFEISLKKINLEQSENHLKTAEGLEYNISIKYGINQSSASTGCD